VSENLKTRYGYQYAKPLSGDTKRAVRDQQLKPLYHHEHFEFKLLLQKRFYFSVTLLKSVSTITLTSGHGGKVVLVVDLSPLFSYLHLGVQKYSNSELHVCPQVADRGNPLVRGGCQVII
jgi:hypothetical protein